MIAGHYGPLMGKRALSVRRVMHSTDGLRAEERPVIKGRRDMASQRTVPV